MPVGEASVVSPMERSWAEAETTPTGEALQLRARAAAAIIRTERLTVLSWCGG